MEQVRKDHYSAFYKHLQAFASMWSFFGCKFFKRDIGSLWHEFGARNAERKALDTHVFLRLHEAKVVLA